MKIPGALLGFKLRFRPMVKDGSKPHTLRGKRKNRPRPGGPAHCYTGLRTKNCDLIGRWIITRVRDVVIQIRAVEPTTMNQMVIAIDGHELDWGETILFAFADGFRMTVGGKTTGDPMAMRHFWEKENGLKPGKKWNGDLIEWDYKRPVDKEGSPLRARKAAK